ncbi:hypothetical protein J6590_000994 [Homalodisca vitripennis]|nr:hypothetical protein J6590_000994 [Homalodisca vitripennis]
MRHRFLSTIDTMKAKYSRGRGRSTQVDTTSLFLLHIGKCYCPFLRPLNQGVCDSRLTATRNKEVLVCAYKSPLMAGSDQRLYHPHRLRAFLCGIKRSFLIF